MVKLIGRALKQHVNYTEFDVLAMAEYMGGRLYPSTPFRTYLIKYNLMEEYLNKVKQLSD